MEAYAIDNEEQFNIIPQIKNTTNQLIFLRESIENMNKFNQIEILRMLKNDTTVILNENKYGVHVNLSELNNQNIDQMYNYVKYVNAQQVSLDTAEKQKEAFKNTYFSKDN
jgi:septum formation inhibitor-activating ATPase MinD